MSLFEIRALCLGLAGFSEDCPFDEATLAFRVGGKIFLLCDSVNFTGVNLKCEPGLAAELRERYSSVKPGYHMNKKHWNTVEIPGDYPASELKAWVLHSYQLVFSSLPAKIRQQISPTAEH